MKTANRSTATDDLAQMLKGLYERVARELGVAPYYVSRAARGEFKSKIVEAELERELKRILARASGRKEPIAHNRNKAHSSAPSRRRIEPPAGKAHSS